MTARYYAYVNASPRQSNSTFSPNKASGRKFIIFAR